MANKVFICVNIVPVGYLRSSVEKTMRNPIGNWGCFRERYQSQYQLADRQGSWLQLRHPACYYQPAHGWPASRPSWKIKMFAINSQNMLVAGVKKMSYAWFDPRYKVCAAADQAAKYLETVGKFGVGELGPMIDIEDAPAAGIYGYVGVGSQIKLWLDAVETKLKVKPRIYTNSQLCAELFVQFFGKGNHGSINMAW